MKKRLFRLGMCAAALAVLTCSDAPVPQIDSVSPSKIHYKATTVGLKVSGSGFTQKDKPISRLILGGMPAAARVASDNEINATFYPNQRFCGPVTLEVENTTGSIIARSELVSFYSDTVSFQSPVLASVDARKIVGVAVGNWNSNVTFDDGTNDVATDLAVLDDAGTIRLYLGSSPGNATFDAPSTLSTSVASPTGLVASDLNQDGVPDLVVLGKNNVAVLYGNGDGTLQAASVIVSSKDELAGHEFVAISASSQSTSVPRPMLVVASTYLDGATKKTAASFLRRDTNGAFTASVQKDVLPSGETFKAMAVGDFDRDPNQIADVAFAYVGKKQLTFLIAQGDGSYRSRTLSLSFEPVMLIAGDYNSDGVSDIAAFQQQTVSGQPLATTFRVLLGQGSDLPSVQERSGKEVDFDAGYALMGQAVAIGDINRDRKPDMVTVNLRSPADMNPSAVSFSLSQCPLF